MFETHATAYTKNMNENASRRSGQDQQLAQLNAGFSQKKSGQQTPQLDAVVIDGRADKRRASVDVGEGWTGSGGGCGCDYGSAQMEGSESEGCIFLAAGAKEGSTENCSRGDGQPGRLKHAPKDCDVRERYQQMNTSAS